MLDQGYGAPKVTKDGVTVAKAISFSNKYHNMGAQLVIAVAQKTNDIAGDGTTTATLLTHELYREAVKALSAGMDANELRRGMAQAVRAVEAELTRLTKKVTTRDEMAQVATISANGRSVIGNLIADAFQAVGAEGVITVQNGTAFTHELKVTDGLKIDRGYIAPLFVTDQRAMKCEYEAPLVLVTDMKVSSFPVIAPLLDAVSKAGRPLLIVADDVEGDALAAIILNKLKGALKVVAIKAPGFGDNKRATLQDIATVTGATLLSEELGTKLESVRLEELGSCERVTITKDETVVVGGAGSKAAVAGRADEIRRQLETCESTYEKEKMRERLAKLTSGVAVISVGGASELEVGETKDLIEDALNATRAAIEEGVVAGGGVALANCSKALDKLEAATMEQRTGVDIVRNAIRQPLKVIAANAGVSGDVVCERVLASTDASFGYDAATGEYVDMIKAGIVDPKKVVKSALVNAASVAASMTSAGVMIADCPEDKKPAPGLGMY